MDQIKVKINQEPDIKVHIDGTRGDTLGSDTQWPIANIIGLQTELDNINTELDTKAEKGDNSDITSLSGITGGISTVDYIDFNTQTLSIPQEARVNWNDTDGTLNIGLKGGNVTLQVGQETVVMCQNNTGVNFIEGQAVYIYGSTGNSLNIHLAQANTESTSSKTFGVLTENINHNNKGFITTSGLVRNINTLHLTEGAAVWLSPTVAGGLTSVKPTAPNHLVLIGWCVRQHETVGSIFIHVQNGYELEELHDVLITNPQTNDVLSYNSTTGLWENKQIDISSIQNELDAINNEISDINLALDNKADINHNHALSTLTDVDFTGLQPGQTIQWNGTSWIPVNDMSMHQQVFKSIDEQTNFTLTIAAALVNMSIVTVNGVQQIIGTDYTVSGTNLVFTYGLELDDDVIITYFNK